jgi:hypothetical protein
LVCVVLDADSSHCLARKPGQANRCEQTNAFHDN